MSLKPTAIIPACAARATASYALLSLLPAALGKLAAIKVESEGAPSGLPVLLVADMMMPLLMWMMGVMVWRIWYGM